MDLSILEAGDATNHDAFRGFPARKAKLTLETVSSTVLLTIDWARLGARA